jgi:putative flippase GtrA
VTLAARPGASTLPDAVPREAERWDGGESQSLAGWIRRFVSYGFVCSGVALVNLVAFSLIYYNVHPPVGIGIVAHTIWYVAVVAVATEIATMANFLVNDRITFSRLPGHGRSWWARCLRFHLTSLMGMLLTLAISFTLAQAVGLTAILAQAIAIASAFIFTFAMHHIFTYRRAHPLVPSPATTKTLPIFPEMRQVGRLLLLEAPYSTAESEEMFGWSSPSSHTTSADGVSTTTRLGDETAQPAPVPSPWNTAGAAGYDTSIALSGAYCSANVSGAQQRAASALDIKRVGGLSVIVPAYNEEATIKRVLERVMARPEVTEVVVVDDGSSDGTAAVVQSLLGIPRLRFLRHERNQGKGAGIRTGVAAATQGVIIIQDADFEYSPDDYPLVLAPIVEGRADVVYGSRYLTPRPYAFWLDLANRLLTLATNLLFGARLTDMETCYKAFKADVLKSVVIRSNRFDFEPEITAKVLRQRRRVVEVPISYERRGYESGKKIRLSDAFAAVRALIRFRFGD